MSLAQLIVDSHPEQLVHAVGQHYYIPLYAQFQLEVESFNICVCTNGFKTKVHLLKGESRLASYKNFISQANKIKLQSECQNNYQFFYRHWRMQVPEMIKSLNLLEDNV